MNFTPDNDDRLWKSEEPKGWYRFGSPLRFIVFIALLVALVIVCWYLLSSSRQTFTPNELAYIEADNTPYKVQAEDQGVPHIKHQDKLIYGRIRNDQQEPIVEHILPDPEEPSLKMVEQFVNEETKSDPTKATLIENNSEISSIADLIEDPSFDSPPPQPKKEGTIYLQFASFKTKKLADSEWKELTQEHEDILGSCEALIERVDLGASKGIEYRIRTGPFQTPQEAQKIHAKLKERKVDCVVIQ